MLSIIIPLRNEIENLDSIKESFSNSLGEINYEVLFINDFSTDGTLQKANKIAEENINFKVFDNKKRGLGGAINLGIEKCNGEYTCITMADLSDDFEDLKKYYNKISKENLDAVFGSRFMKNTKVLDYPFRKLILNRIFNFLCRFYFLINTMIILMHLKFIILR